MRSNMLIFILMLLFVSVSAQQKQMTLENAVAGQLTYLKPSALENITWKDDRTFTYLKNDTLWSEDALIREKKMLAEIKDLLTIIISQSKEQPGNFQNYSWNENGEIILRCDNGYYTLNLSADKLISRIILPENSDNIIFNASGQYVVYTVDDDLYIKYNDDEVRQITSDGGNGIVNGKSVHRNEFGISGGIFISPENHFIAFYRKDESMVSQYPLVNYMERVAEFTPVRYPMAGMESEQVKIGIYDIFTNNTIFLKTKPGSDHYLTNLSWSPDEKHVYLAELNREQNHMKLNCYNTATGEKTKTLFEEKHDKYVEPLYPLCFSGINKNEFYYISRRDGWYHIYKYNTEGRLIRQISKGEWDVTRFAGFDKDEKFLFVEATKDSYLENNIYRVEVRTGKIKKLNRSEGIHAGDLSPEGSFIIDTWNSTHVPLKSDLISSNGKDCRTIHEAEDPLKDYILGENKLVTMVAADGKTELAGRLILPVNFNASAKYPVIVYVYGGPHLQLVSKSWHNSSRWWEYYMASKGFIVFVMDGRGSANRGRLFEEVTHRRLGVLETQDQIKGVEYLKSLPFVDSERIGVHGWSYGGYMTLNLMLRHPDIFRVGVAGGPVVDWSMYEVMYGERYMDMPSENPEGYTQTNMINYVSNLKGKLLIIHGMQDDVVVMQHSIKFLRECVKQGKQVDFFPYPVHKHNVTGKDRIHLMEKVSNYFIDNL